MCISYFDGWCYRIMYGFDFWPFKCCLTDSFHELKFGIPRYHPNWRPYLGGGKPSFLGGGKPSFLRVIFPYIYPRTQPMRLFEHRLHPKNIPSHVMVYHGLSWSVIINMYINIYIYIYFPYNSHDTGYFMIFHGYLHLQWHTETHRAQDQESIANPWTGKPIQCRQLAAHEFAGAGAAGAAGAERIGTGGSASSASRKK